MKPLPSVFGVLTLFVLLLSCSKKKDPLPGMQSLFTLTVNSNYPEPQLWAFVTNSKGEIIASKPTLPGNTIGFEAAQVPDAMNLTVLTYHVGNSNDQSLYTFDTYPDIALNAVITLVQSNGNGNLQIPQGVGNANFTVTNYVLPDFQTPNISLADGFGYIFDNSAPGTASENLMLHGNPSDVLLATHKQDNSQPVYAWINNAHAGDNTTIDFSNFQPFPNTIPLPFPGEVSAFISGYKQTNVGTAKYLISSIDYQGSSASGQVSRVGYLDGFDSFETIVNSTVGIGSSRTKTTSYFKSGAINPSVSLPDYTLNIVDAGLKSFQYSYSGNSVFQIHTWGYEVSNSYVTWNVYSGGSGITALNKFPDDIAAQFSVLDFSKMAYQRSNFYHFIDTYSYHDYFQDFQQGNNPFNNHEYFTIQVQQY